MTETYSPNYKDAEVLLMGLLSVINSVQYDLMYPTHVIVFFKDGFTQYVQMGNSDLAKRIQVSATIALEKTRSM